MSSRFDDALARADAAQLRTFAEDAVFRDPNSTLEDFDITLVPSERDIAEPPSQLSPRGQYSTVWTRIDSLPVVDPTGYQIVLGSDVYNVVHAVADGVGGVVMKLFKVVR